MNVQIELSEMDAINIINALRPIEFKNKKQILEPLEDACLKEFARRMQLLNESKDSIPDLSRNQEINPRQITSRDRPQTQNTH